MKLNRWLVPVLLAAAAVLAGCKKESEKEYKSMDGGLSLSMPAYVLPGYTKTFDLDTLTTLSRADGGKIGYSFTNPDTGKPDTLVTADGTVRHKTYTVTAPDKLGTFTLRLSAFADPDSDYLGASESVSFTVVRPGVGSQSSITHFDLTPISLTDSRDGRVYYTTQAGGHDWMRQNLAWEGAGMPYLDCPAMTDVFGRYYTWEEAQTACPEGWRLPTDADWVALAGGAEAGRDISGLAGKLMGDLYFNGTKMWEYWPAVKITDETFLSVMPTGFATVGEGTGTFQGLYTYAAFWTADESEGLGVCRYIYHDKDILYRGRMSKTDFAASVRCVRKK